MNRRAFLGTLTGGLLTAPLPARAKPADAMPIIGYLEAASPSLVQPMREAFRQGLREHGWVENRDVRIEYRSAEGRNERFPEMAAEMVRLNVNVMVVTGEP